MSFGFLKLNKYIAVIKQEKRIKHNTAYIAETFQEIRKLKFKYHFARKPVLNPKVNSRIRIIV